MRVVNLDEQCIICYRYIDNDKILGLKFCPIWCAKDYNIKLDLSICNCEEQCEIKNQVFALYCIDSHERMHLMTGNKLLFCNTNRNVLINFFKDRYESVSYISDMYQFICGPIDDLGNQYCKLNDQSTKSQNNMKYIESKIKNKHQILKEKIKKISYDDEINRLDNEIDSLKDKINDMTDNINELKNMMDDFMKLFTNSEKS